MQKTSLIFFIAISFLMSASAETLEPLTPLLKYLITTAENHKINTNESVPVIGIGGCPGVGKTYLTQHLINELKSMGIRCITLPLDHFNFSPEDRKKIGTEWDIRHFKILELHKVLSLIHEGSKSIQKPICNQLTGEIGLEIIDLTNVDLILFDGLYALCTKDPLNFFSYCTEGIFIEADKADIYKWKWEREQKKSRPRTPAEFECHISALFEEFENNISYSKENAYFLIKKDSFHNYNLEENTNKENSLKDKAA